VVFFDIERIIPDSRTEPLRARLLEREEKLRMTRKFFTLRGRFFRPRLDPGRREALLEAAWRMS
jgi:hypothetical protein